MLKQTLFLDALRGKNRHRTPIWLMRQAGRILPSYRALRERYSLSELFHQPELIHQVTSLATSELHVDAAICFSDILFVLDACDIQWKIDDQKGPSIEPFDLFKPLEIKNDPKKAFQPLLTAISSLKKELTVPLIGFAPAPFTLACYLIEGASPKNLNKSKIFIYQHPEHFLRLLDQLTSLISLFLQMQIASGADAVQLFDSLTGDLSLYEFQNFALAPSKKVLKDISKAPSLLYCKNSAAFCPLFSNSDFSAISIDGSLEMTEAREKIPLPKALQGNIEPHLLFAEKTEIKKRVEALLLKMKCDPGFIVNLASPLLPSTPLDSVKFLIDLVQDATS